MVQYYPKHLSVATVARQYPELEIVDEEEQQRLRDVEDRRRRGKGPPKKVKKDGRLRALYSVYFFVMHFG
jgi:hypothetical protein